ncbi:MAG TPA: hypothetical protein VK633_08475, partial [Verrucomicrobiae bacterium]|nr:hypothetical protein [Verrucomicrobiae bacterium]
DRMMANTLAHRLRKIAKFQDDVGQSLQKILPETIGLLPKDLPAKHATTTARLTSGQEKSGQETQQLEEEITRFFHRTSVTNYGSVSKEMKETKVVETLSANTEMIRQNISAQAMQEAGKLASQFNAWAKRLEASKKPSDQAGEGDQAGDKVDEAALERLLALLRVRQGEVNLRQHTQVLDQIKKGRSSYLEDSGMLSVRQSLLVDDVKDLQEQDPGKFLGQTKAAMGEAQNLLQKPRTDDPTVAAETDAVNLLEAEIMAMVDSQDGKSQAQGAAMAMLMQMMGMNGMGKKPGANFAGGDTDKASGPITGNTTGNGDRERETGKTTGRDTRPVPVEYREALQNYHKAIETIAP